MKITPNFGYLPYNLGLIYQRLNRRKEAEEAYRKSSALSPASAEPLNALGTLKAAEGKTAEAEKLYRAALEKNPNLLPARHNLACSAVFEQRPPGRSHRSLEAEPRGESRIICLRGSRSPNSWRSAAIRRALSNSTGK